ncbi:MAG TPA: PLP-dependent aminotransferase family protein [Proteiniclasticum sp.]|nr:PLP-dependent aminotransferase family protein [Proteiniclasticum sp.]
MNMLTCTLDSDSRILLYEQLYLFIKSEIRSGKIPCHTKLPSKRRLSSHLKISQNTIQTAYEQLAEEGYIESIERSGFYVNKLENVIKLDIEEPSRIIDSQDSLLAVDYDFSYHGVDLNTFPYTTWRKLFKEVINEDDEELLLLGDPRGHLSLRSCIAEYLHQSRGVNCYASQIIINSGTEFLFQILIQLLDEDSIYGIENPGYEKLNLLFSTNQAKFRAIDIDDDGMKLEEIAKTESNILCITPAHQFPSGQVMPINRRAQILNWANGKDDRYIIEDDYDSEFKYSGKPIPSLQGLDNNDKVIYMGSFSKSLSPSLRISYMVLPAHLLARYMEKLSYISCPVPMMDQKVLARFMEDGHFEKHLNKMRTIYKKKRELLVKAIKRWNTGMEVLGAEAGLHLLLRVNNGMTEEELELAALLNKVKVYGVSKYDADLKKLDDRGTVLIGYATKKESDIDMAVSRLHQAWF